MTSSHHRQTQFLFEGRQPPQQLTAWQPQEWPVADDWRAVVAPFLASDVARELGQFICQRLASGAVIYPPQPFRALQLTALAQVKVVILGQDPYHGPGQAQGLAFSVAHGVKQPPSLRNIFKEIAADPALAPHNPAARDGCLECWAKQGVLLLNTCLTVEDGQPASHARRGWEVLTTAIVSTIAASKTPVVFLLWGAHAQSKKDLIEAVANKITPSTRHLVLTANHPSPLSALRAPTPFLGCGHFGAANAFLTRNGCLAVQW
jgi:uracil-DNA glycosylase